MTNITVLGVSYQILNAKVCPAAGEPSADIVFYARCIPRRLKRLVEYDRLCNIANSTDLYNWQATNKQMFLTQNGHPRTASR